MPRLVFFDLDGTVTRADTLVPYAFGFTLRRRPWRLLALATVLPTLLRFLLRRADHGELKGELIHALLGGARREEIERWNQDWIPRLIARELHAAALEAIRAHRAAGDRLVLMSASVDLYVPSLAEALGFDEAICSGVRWDGARLNGRLMTPNRRGEEKSRCLRESAARYPGWPTVAYGNSSPDLPHLAIADRGVLVNAGKALSARARAAGVERGAW